jgi:integrase/recombinase XerD
MLESYFQYGQVLRRMRCGPLATEIDEIAEELRRIGYSYLSAKRYLSLIATFSRYASRWGCRQPSGIDRNLVERFLANLPLSTSGVTLARTATGHALRYVARRFPSPAHSARSQIANCSLLADFDSYLRDIRGLEAKTREGLIRAGRRFLAWHRKSEDSRSLSQLTPKEVLAYASHIARQCVTEATRSGAMSYLRGVLRYLKWAGICQEDLSRYVPRVPIRRMARIPDYLPWEDVNRLVESIDTSDPMGKRDRALLLLVATTGMRNGEVRRLQLRDIRWRQGEVLLRRTKTGRDRVVPLVQEAGSALAEYILHGRPKVAESRVFLIHRPPVRPIKVSTTVSAIVGRRLKRLGIRPPHAGTHLLRHSVATQMVWQDRPVKEIADLLGHQTIESTAVYIKVALPQLASVALPFPGGEA